MRIHLGDELFAALRFAELVGDIEDMLADVRERLRYAEFVDRRADSVSSARVARGVKAPTSTRSGRKNSASSALP